MSELDDALTVEALEKLSRRLPPTPKPGDVVDLDGAIRRLLNHVPQRPHSLPGRQRPRQAQDPHGEAETGQGAETKTTTQQPG